MKPPRGGAATRGDAQPRCATENAPPSACLCSEAEPSRYVSLGKFPDRSGKVGEVEVLRCTHCGHGVSRPPIPDVGFLYENRESQDYQPDSKGLARAIKEIAFRSFAKKLARQIGVPDGRILDYGCGSGQFTRLLGDVARGSEVIGADMHADGPPELGERAYRSFSELSGLEGSFDVVVAMHVLEHDDDVIGLLAKIAGYARPGGRIVIEVPNIDCVWTDWFKSYWDAWYLPYHRHHFTRGSLVNLVRRSGLAIESVRGVTVPTMGRSFANIFGRKNTLFWLLLGMLAHPLQLAAEVLTRRRTAIRVIAAKR